MLHTVPCTPRQSRCHSTFLYLGGWEFKGPGFEPLFQTGSPNNSCSYSSRTMDKLINATRTSNSLSAFYRYADYTAEQVPSFWLPFPVTVEAVSKHMHDVSQSRLFAFYPEYWRCSRKSC
jgi:hypothetical protein